MKNSIGLIGRIATLGMAALFFEGMMTLGQAFDFSGYPTVGWIAQAFMLCIVVWGGFEWHEDATKSQK